MGDGALGCPDRRSLPGGRFGHVSFMLWAISSAKRLALSPWPYTELDAIKEYHSVAVVGSGLTAVDVVRYLGVSPRHKVASLCVGASPLHRTNSAPTLGRNIDGLQKRITSLDTSALG